jgi:hypothetical protein
MSEIHWESLEIVKFSTEDFLYAMFVATMLSLRTPETDRPGS